MEHWPILSNVVKYVQYERYLKNLHALNIKALDQENDRKMSEKIQKDSS